MTTENTDRYSRLIAWMEEYDISFAALGDELNLSTSAARKVCRNATCPVQHHKKMLELGFPVELLPAPEDKPRGRPRKIARFPGKATANMQQATA